MGTLQNVLREIELENLNESNETLLPNGEESYFFCTTISKPTKNN